MLQDLHRDEDVASDYGKDYKSLLSLSTAGLTPKSVSLVTQSLAASSSTHRWLHFRLC